MSVIFHPYSARARVICLRETSAAAWAELMQRMFADLALQLRDAGALAIGHIKGIASNGNHHLYVNCVSAGVAPDTAGALDDACEIDLVLTVLVYGLAWRAVSNAVSTALQRTCDQSGFAIHLQPVAFHVHRHVNH